MSEEEKELRAILATAQEARIKHLQLAHQTTGHYAYHIEAVAYLDGEILELTNRILALRQE